jgi:hypothetical protein
LSVNSATSPDGYVNADIATETATTSQHGLSSGVISFTSGTTYTFSAFAKNAPSGRGFIQLYGFQLGAAAANVFANFNLNTGVVGTATGGTSAITNYGNGWYRCTFTFTCGNSLSERINLFNVTSASATAGQSYAGDITKAIYWYGAQVEAGAYATSYIKTEAAAVTRLADDCKKTSISSLIGQTAGTVFYEFTFDNFGESAGEKVLWYMKDGGTGERYLTVTDTQVLAYVDASGGTVQANLQKTGITVGTYKVAIAYANNDFVMYVNGTLASSDTSGTVAGFSTFGLQYYSLGAAGRQMAKQALLFKTRLTNAQLAELTTL